MAAGRGSSGNRGGTNAAGGVSPVPVGCGGVKGLARLYRCGLTTVPGVGGRCFAVTHSGSLGKVGTPHGVSVRAPAAPEHADHTPGTQVEWQD